MTNRYLKKHPFCEKQITESPSEKLGIVVTIPCYNEPDLFTSLSSIYDCVRPDCDVEVIVVVNSPQNCTVAVLEQNKRTIREADAWISKHIDTKIKFYILDFLYLPQKHAGVGMARKIGMDEAVRRFDFIKNHEDGIIACFDADCQCEKNYLKSIESHFKNNPKTPACSIYYEHRWSECHSKLQEAKLHLEQQAIIKYELFLRYYMLAWRYTGHPYSYYTIGSCMAVRSSVYQSQGGMNRRKAGEDFYFLQKIIQLGDFTELNATTVYPSPRRSTRVPFGTGKAVIDWLTACPSLVKAHSNSNRWWKEKSGNGEWGQKNRGDRAAEEEEKSLQQRGEYKLSKNNYYTYNPKTFEDLKIFCSKIPSLYKIAPRQKEISKFLDKMPASIRTFLIKNAFSEHFKEILVNTTSEKTFTNRFYRWFNGLKVLQFVHFARDHYYDNIPIEDASITLLKSLNYLHGKKRKITSIDLLLNYRKL